MVFLSSSKDRNCNTAILMHHKKQNETQKFIFSCVFNEQTEHCSSVSFPNQIGYGTMQMPCA